MRKKLVAIMTTISILCASIMTFIGFNLKFQGSTEAAKILLSRANLNTDAMNISFSTLLGRGQSVESVDLESTAISHSIASSAGELIHDSLGGKVHKSGDTYTWSNLSGATGTGLVLESRFYGIERQAKEASAIIDYIKTQANITGKWLKDPAVADTYHLLEVYEGKEVIYSRTTIDDDLYITVCERVTNDSAKSIYYIYNICVNKDTYEQEISPSYYVYIPNERYEYYYEHGGGSPDYKIADNSLGYWCMTSIDDDSAYFVSVLDHYAYYNYFSRPSGSPTLSPSTAHTLISTTLDSQPITVGSSSITIQSGSFDGISSLSYDNSIDDRVSTYQSNEDGIAYEIYPSADMNIHLTNGSTITPGQTFASGKVSYTDASIQYHANPGFADPQYGDYIYFSVEGSTVNERLDNFTTFMSETGLSLKSGSISNMKSTIYSGSALADSYFKNFKWNGYSVETLDGFTQGQAVLHSTFTRYYDMYEEVKDHPVYTDFVPRMLPYGIDFASISAFSHGSSTHTDGTISTDGMSMSISDTSLLEVNREYVLKVGISRIDTHGHFVSENTISFASATTTPVKWTEGTLTVSDTNTYSVPLNISEGEYGIVAYIATADTGIRVSQIYPISFDSATTDSIPSTAMQISLTYHEDKTLDIRYDVINVFELDTTAIIDYSYSSVYDTAVHYIMTKGYTKDDEGIEVYDTATESSTPISSASTLSTGTYRIKFYVHTTDGIAEAYLYLTLS